MVVDMTQRVSYDATTWAARRVGTDWICTLLDIKQTSLHQLIQRGTFPPSSAARGRPGEWPLVHVMDFVQTHRPERAGLLPRLWPRVNPPLPALFLGARQVRIKTSPTSERRPYVVYTFQPSDGGGPVALAYTLEGNGAVGGPPRGLLRELKADMPELSAVALTNGAYYVDVAGDLEPPEIAVADDSAFDHQLNNLSWFDLAYLLQIDLPVWPFVLRDRFAMQVWEPGDRPGRAQVIPQLPYGNPYAFSALASDHGNVAKFTTAWAEFIAQSLYANEDAPAAVPAGVCLAATAISPNTRQELQAGARPDPVAVTPEETLQVLYSPAVADDVAAIRDLAAEFRVFEPWIANIIDVSTKTPNPIARQWLDALEPAPDRGDDIGWLYVCAAAQETYRIAHPGSSAASAIPTRLVYKPRGIEVPMWIVRIGDTVFLSVPTHFRDATGSLTRLDITQTNNTTRHDFTAWWLDSAQVAWPMAGRFNYTAGYDGNGPDTLARAATLLTDDATGAVTPETVRTVRASDPGYESLSKLLIERHHPTAFVPSTQ